MFLFPDMLSLYCSSENLGNILSIIVIDDGVTLVGLIMKGMSRFDAIVSVSM